MRIGITANPHKAVAVDLARRVVGRLAPRAELVVSDELGGVGGAAPHVPLDAMRADLLVAIGGDGTFLYALARTEIPLLPVNAGTEGILAELAAGRPREVDAAMDRLVDGFYHVEDRMKLAAEIDHTPLPDATNDVVLHAAPVGRMARFDVSVDGESAGRLRADGVIVSSPTGSTAYSLSAFGPILDPGLDALVLTSIAPFRAEARALVLEPLRTVCLRALDRDQGSVVLVDGSGERPMPPGATLTVYRSPRRARIVRFGASFFSRLRGKGILPWAEGGASGGGEGAGVPPPA